MSKSTITTLAVIVVAVAASNSALAGGCGGKKYYGGASNLHHRYISNNNHGVYKTRVYHKPVVVHRPVVIEKHVVNHCHHPKFCLAYVCPGETLLSICGREYGNPNFWTKVAAFNKIPVGAPLVVGQPIKLPAIYDCGRMIPSTAPAPPAPAIPVPAAPVAVGAPVGPAPQIGLPQAQPMLRQGPPMQQQGMPQAQPQQQLQVQPISQQQMGSPAPQMNIRQAERNLPTFTTGSQLVLDGQRFGGAPGQVMLVVGPMELPVGIANWTPSEVSIQLPELPLTKATDARIVVLNGEGALVTQSEFRLAPKTSRLAMGN